MRIIVCADIHDNIWTLARALEQMRGADALICCGDLCAPFTLVQIAESFARPIHLVWGNNDGDKWLLAKQGARFDHVRIHGDLAELELDGLRIAVNHYPEIARGVVRGGGYDLVCYGHDHIAHTENVGEAVLLNPGEIMGRLGKSTYAVFDTGAREARICPVRRRDEG